MRIKYDFSGYATRNDLRCKDGRVIKRNAFAHNDGITVPLVWMHGHEDPGNVIGHALLENRKDGVYAFCSLNDSRKAKDTKEGIRHGDLNQLSIYANHLIEKGKDVLHGDIKEVSVVMSGANPGAWIDNRFEIVHSDMETGEEWTEENEDDERAVFYTGSNVVLKHGSIEIEHDEEDEQEDDEEIEHADEDEEESIGDVIDTLTEKQLNAVMDVFEQIIGDIDSDDDDKEDDSEDEELEMSDFDDEEEENMKYNPFEGVSAPVLTHDDMKSIFDDAKECGSLKKAVMHSDVLQHSITDHNGKTVDYGIANIDYLFPDARKITNTPDFIKRETGWVAKVMNSTHHTPFTRIKSIYADITMDEARARGYIKGNRKVEEVFSLLKRSTDPQTIYKKQKLDHDDIIDIIDFDVVVWLKQEMRMMLDEEIARAILVGDGRLSTSNDKIQESHVRSIYNDDDLYSIKVPISVGSGDNADKTAKSIIRAIIKSRKDYKGTGEPTMYIGEDLLTDLLLLEDGIGHLLYDSQSKLATALRVKEIVSVPVMEGLQRTATFTPDGETTPVTKIYDLAAIIVNLTDYNIGADKGGSVQFFEDFDIDYNQEKYLIETRISGALTKPFSAMVIELDRATE